MQLRTRKNGTALIRTQYDPAIKRCRAFVVATLAHDARELPTDLRERLTHTERHQVEIHLAVQTAGLSRVAEVAAAQDLARVLRQAASWYRQQKPSPQLARQAEAARGEWTELLAAMSTAGVGRKRQRRAAKATLP